MWNEIIDGLTWAARHSFARCGPDRREAMRRGQDAYSRRTAPPPIPPPGHRRLPDPEPIVNLEPIPDVDLTLEVSDYGRA
jgi:hypothetical protein